MRQGGALGRAGGARRVLDVDRVVAVQAGLALRQRVFADRRTLVEQRVPVVVEHHDLLQVRTAAPHALEDGGVVGGAEPAGEQQQADAGLLERVFQLAGAIRRVDVDQDRADARGRILRDDPLAAVGRPDADAVAPGDAARQERQCEPRREVPQLPVAGAEILRADHQRVAVRPPLDGVAQVGADGFAQQARRGRAVQIREIAHCGPIIVGMP